jgi:hypothetical protein
MTKTKPCTYSPPAGCHMHLTSEMQPLGQLIMGLTVMVLQIDADVPPQTYPSGKGARNSDNDKAYMPTVTGVRHARQLGRAAHAPSRRASDAHFQACCLTGFHTGRAG